MLKFYTETEEKGLNLLPDIEPQTFCLHQLLEDQFKKSPDKIAVVYQDESLTCEVLDKKSNQIAHYLIKCGISPGTRVGLSVRRSMEMISGLLGILKAGGTFVPLDPEYPGDRLSFIINDAEISYILAAKKFGDKFPLYQEAETIFIDELPDNMPETGPGIDVRHYDLACCIYTSGSTGQPKGVLVEHKALVKHAGAVKKVYDLTENDRFLQFASLNHITGLEQIITALSSGTRLVLREPEIWTPSEFPGKITKYGLTIIDLPTGYYHVLVEKWAKMPDWVENTSLRLVITGDESISMEIVKLWNRTYLNKIRMIHGFGMTEASGTATFFNVSGKISNTLPIGKALNNMAAYILDKKMQQVSNNVTGELYLAGESLARGYLNRPDLTQERFIPNPFSKEKGGILYKTGDLARFLPDGSIEHMGRADNQIKLRGFRVETGEIESFLIQYPGVEKAAVIPYGSGADKQLSAYLTIKNKSRKSQDQFKTELRHYLAKKLPAYMVPEIFVILDTMPLTPNGKVDRNALPAPETGISKKEIITPQTDSEIAVSKVIREVLKIEHIDIDMDFSELGVNSLQLLQIQSRLETIFDREINMPAIFNNPSVRLLAGFLYSGKTGTKEKNEDIIVPGILLERKQQLDNFLKVIKNVNTLAVTQPKKQRETRNTRFQSVLKRAAVNADMFRRAYEGDAKVCYIGSLMCPEIAFAMDMIPLNVEINSSLFAANNAAAGFLDIGEQNHFSRDVCSLFRCMEGAIIENCLPTPNFLCYTSYYCDSSAKMGYRLKDEYQSGYYMLDIPYNSDKSSVLYLAGQIKSMIAQMEDSLKIKLDPEKLKQAVGYSKESLKYLLKTTALYQNNSVPASFPKLMDCATSFMTLSGAEDMVEIAKLNYEEELKEIAQGKDAVKKRPKIIWAGLTPFYNNEIIRYLEDICNIDLIPEYYLPYVDIQSLLDIDEPYHYLAQKLINFSVSSPLNSAITRNGLNTLEKYCIDGVIIFNQWGCRIAFSTNQVNRNLLSEKNIPVLEIDGDYIDNRNHSFSQTKVRIDAFAEILQSRIF